MKLNTIKNAYIKNKPAFNYQILDQDNVLVAKGHLLSSRQKQNILKLARVQIDQKGQIAYKIDNFSQFAAQ